MEKLFKEREKVLRELEHAEAVLEKSKTKEGGDGVRPTHKTGFKGWWGPKVDTIDYLENRSAYLTNQFEEERQHVLQEEKSNTAFVIFNNRCSAAQASQVNPFPLLESKFLGYVFACIQQPRHVDLLVTLRLLVAVGSARSSAAVLDGGASTRAQRVCVAKPACF